LPVSSYPIVYAKEKALSMHLHFIRCKTYLKMHNVLSLSIFYRKTTKSKKLEFSDREIEELNKKKIIKIEPVK
jgi:hypothetical protein